MDDETPVTVTEQPKGYDTGIVAEHVEAKDENPAGLAITIAFGKPNRKTRFLELLIADADILDYVERYFDVGVKVHDASVALTAKTPA